MKTFALIARRPDLTRDAFRAHYETVHAPLAIETVLEGTVRYVRNHLREVRFGTPRFDVVTAFWFRDAAAALAVGRRLAEPQGRAILADELTFMDKPANTTLAVSEHPVVGDEGAPAPWRAVALVGAPRGEDAAGFVEGYEKEQVPRLLDAVAAPTWCLQHRALPADEAPAFDAVTQLHGAGEGGVVAWARALADAGARVVVATVTEHESALPWA